MKRLLGVALLGALALATTACAPPSSASAAKDAGKDSAPVAQGASQAGAQAVTVTMTDMQFSPATVTVKAGTSVTFTAPNKGVLEHNWHVKIGNETIQIDARPGQTATQIFTPTTPGTYTVICTIPGHEQAGMKGTLIVE